MNTKEETKVESTTAALHATVGSASEGRSWRTRAVALLLVPASISILAACNAEPETLPAKGHHVVHVDTDAWVPADDGFAPDPSEPPALFDRLSLSIIQEGASEPCAECTRDFSVDVHTFEKNGASFTVESEAGTRPTVRASLYRAESVIDGRLRPETAIVVMAKLPVTPKEGAVDTTLELSTDDVGVPARANEVVEPSDDESARVRNGVISTSKVRTWPGVNRGECAGTPSADEVCVPGGAYWMGNPLVKGDGFSESDKQRLVVLSPFYLDSKEVTVGEFRAWADNEQEPFDVTTAEDAEGQYCTYTSAPGEKESFPVNCVGWETARKYCEDRGATLPTEAQFEYASSALRSALYIWGQDEAAVCGAAVWGRADGGIPGATGVNDSCNGQGVGAQPLENPDTTRATDRIILGGRAIYDLAGNLQEWMIDRFNDQDEPCWQANTSNVFVDPLCDNVGAAGSSRAVRGGAWVQDRAFLRAAYRTSRAPDEKQRYVVGFRCARSARLP